MSFAPLEVPAAPMAGKAESGSGARRRKICWRDAAFVERAVENVYHERNTVVSADCVRVAERSGEGFAVARTS